MHATAITSAPTMLYWNAQTLDVMHQVIFLQQKGYDVYFTIDAGANIILIFKEALSQLIAESFPDIIISKAQFEE